MKEQVRDIAICQAFECLHCDSSKCGSSFPFNPHSHYFSEVLLVREGCCRVFRGNQTHTLKSGELLYIAPLLRHSIESADDNPVIFDVVKFSATRLREIPFYLSDLRSLSLDAAQARLPIQMDREEVDHYHLNSIIHECIVECEQHRFAWELHVRALIYLLITGLSRFWISKRKSLISQTPAPRDPILDIPFYIEQHISEPIRVEDLARYCSLSYPWFAKRFRDFYGVNCKQFIEHLRAEKVEQYLIYSDLDLSEISSRTGYTDCSHMVKDFRRVRNTTPGQFRSQMKAQKNPSFAYFSNLSVSPPDE